MKFLLTLLASAVCLVAAELGQAVVVGPTTNELTATNIITVSGTNAAFIGGVTLHTLATTSAVTAASVDVTGALTGGSTNVWGALAALSASAANWTGSGTTNSGLAGNATMHGLTATGAVAAASVTATGDVTAKRLLLTIITISPSDTNYTVDLSAGSKFQVINPAANFGLIVTNGTTGQEATIGVRQDSTGNRIATLAGTNWIYGSDITGVTLSTNAGYWDWLKVFCISNTYQVVGMVRGYTAP